jgi:hypothetical protein
LMVLCVQILHGESGCSGRSIEISTVSLHSGTVGNGEVGGALRAIRILFEDPGILDASEDVCRSWASGASIWQMRESSVSRVPLGESSLHMMATRVQLGFFLGVGAGGWMAVHSQPPGDALQLSHGDVSEHVKIR